VEERDEKTGTDPEIEGPAEGDDIEAHKRIKLKASSEPGGEDSDDVELHRTTTTTTTTTTT
jgi:hypothetical protein